MSDYLLNFGIQHFALFVSSVVIFVMTPGIDTVFVLNRAISHGTRIGIMTSLGVATGVLVHKVFASIGLASVIAKSTTLFMVVKYLGALYLIYLGLVSIYHAIKNPTRLNLNSDPAKPLTV